MPSLANTRHKLNPSSGQRVRFGLLDFGSENGAIYEEGHESEG